MYSLVFWVDGRFSASIPLFCPSPVEPLVYPLYTLRLGPFLLIYCALYLSKKKKNVSIISPFATCFDGDNISVSAEIFYRLPVKVLHLLLIVSSMMLDMCTLTLVEIYALSVWFASVG